MFVQNQVGKELDIVRPCWQYHGEELRFLLNCYWQIYMNRNDSFDVQPTLISKHVELQPLQREHAAPLLRAAEDGQLWNNKWTLVPDEKNRFLHRHGACRSTGRNHDAIRDHKA